MNDPRNDPRSDPKNDVRAYPDRPFLAVSAAIVRDGNVLLVRRARAPANGLFSLPGGVVEAGGTPHEAGVRRIREGNTTPLTPAAVGGVWRNRTPRTRNPLEPPFGGPPVAAPRV